MFIPCKIPLLLLTNSTVPACKFCRKVDCACKFCRKVDCACKFCRKVDCACKFCRKVDCACKFRHGVIEQLAATSAADEIQQGPICVYKQWNLYGRNIIQFMGYLKIIQDSILIFLFPLHCLSLKIF